MGLCVCSTFSELLDALAAQHIQCSVILSCWLNHGIIETVNKIKHYCTFLFREIKIKMEGGLGHAFRSKIRNLVTLMMVTYMFILIFINFHKLFSEIEL